MRKKKRNEFRRRESFNLHEDLYILYHKLLKKRGANTVTKHDRDGYPLAVFITDYRLPKALGEGIDNFVIVVDEYPARPPRGFYLRSGSPNIPLIKSKLKGHVYVSSGTSEYHQMLKDDGWTWICYHYPSFQWKYGKKKGYLCGSGLFTYFPSLIGELS